MSKEQEPKKSDEKDIVPSKEFLKSCGVKDEDIKKEQEKLKI